MGHVNILISKIGFKSLGLWFKTIGPGKAFILISTEPESAYPPNFRWLSKAITQQQFYPGRLTSTGAAVRYPIDMDRSHVGGIERARQACFVASNRFSPLPKSNYTLRAQLAADTETNKIKVRGNYWGLGQSEKLIIVIKHVIFSLFAGSPISISKCKSYISQSRLDHKPIKDKFAFMTKFSVAVVIENENSYISEKLIESIQAGCIPVYVGPEIPEGWIPKELYFRAMPDLESIYVAIARAFDADLETIQAKQSEWLAGSSARLWSRDEVQRQIELQIGRGEIIDRR